MKKFLITLVALSAIAVAQGQNLLTNPSFELQDTSGGDVAGPPTGWFGFNDVFQSSQTGITPTDGVNLLKMFGPFFAGGAAGVGQNLPAAPGDQFLGTADMLNPAADAMGGDTFSIIKLEFFDSGGSIISFAESTQLKVGDPTNVWNSYSVSATAPAGTVSVNYLLLHVQPTGNIGGGSTYFDNASFTQVPEPATFAFIGGALALGVVLYKRRKR